MPVVNDFTKIPGSESEDSECDNCNEELGDGAGLYAVEVDYRDHAEWCWSCIERVSGI